MNARYLALILVACLVGATRIVPAATFVVSDLSDAGPGTLRQAILDANGTSGDDTINFSATGTITLASTLPPLMDNTTIVGPGVDLLTISGSNACRVLTVSSGTTNLISDLTIAKGWAYNRWSVTNQDPALINGAGISNSGALKLVNCTVRDCTGSYCLGTGIYNAGALDVDSCTITNSRCTGGDNPVTGGGIYNAGSLKVKNSRIVKCFSQNNNGAPGGGIYNAGSMLLVTTTVSECSGYLYPDGAGIRNIGNAVLNDCYISTCQGWFGGGINNSGSLWMTNSTVNGNSGALGGGLVLWHNSTNVFVGCSIYGNYGGGSGGGGGFVNYGATKLYNCTISQNGVTGNVWGAGIDHKSGTLYLNHCTVASNFVNQTSTAQEVVVVAGFTAENSLLADCQGTLISGGHNLIAKTNGCSIVGDPTGNLLSVNPNLGPLQNNGGSTLTMALLPGSPAIDAALDGGLSTDQRGYGRSGAVDIGAYEVSTFQPLVAIRPSLQITRTTPGSITLSWPAKFAPFVLQQRSDLTDGDWADVGIEPNNDGTTVQVILSVSTGNNYFRLRSP